MRGGELIHFMKLLSDISVTLVRDEWGQVSIWQPEEKLFILIGAKTKDRFIEIFTIKFLFKIRCSAFEK